MLVVIVLAVFLLANAAVSPEIGDFTYSGFKSANLSLDGLAVLTGTGLLRLTNVTKQKVSHAFYPDPIGFKNSFSGAVHLFSTTFVFAIILEYLALGGHGFAFVIAPSRGIPGAWPNFFWGLFNETNIGNATNHNFTVEFETVQNNELRNINDNHVGIYVNGLTSIKSSPAGYTENNVQGFRNLSLISGKAMQAWVDSDGVQKQISVTLAPVNVDKPNSPLLFLSYKLSSIFIETMYVGF
ncbi:L-type lectin-domain containing receptor kinase IV.2-like [Eucalyptus grandis]|uniref:L-type lectin-domain containing receptor kinase IV.2-like n=1 Tax=Eucalyptus grandis TaxID=71139 RepID=UPI00192E9790|nr:L-type lectin-domain containing receptor kinase IV.2-like [Eucalyptus grandis]